MKCHSKPHPQMLEELLSSSFFLQSALMIGTHARLQMASNASVSALAVATVRIPADLLDSMVPLARLHSVRSWVSGCAKRLNVWRGIGVGKSPVFHAILWTGESAFRPRTIEIQFIA